MTQEYWNRKHKDNYSKQDWAYKPSLFAQQAIKYFPDFGKVLEIGTGQGGDADFFQSEGYEVTATDYSDKALESARERIDGVNFIKIDTSEGLSFEDESFDIVYSHMAIHYFDKETTEKIIRDIYRVLKKDGILALITNTINDPEIDEKIYEKIEDEYYYDSNNGINKRYFSVESMNNFTKEFFDKIILDEEGETYKDDIKLIRFIGTKK